MPPPQPLLTRRFGPELVNYMSGPGLNRVSFLRKYEPFLMAAFAHPDARFVILRGLEPLIRDDQYLCSLGRGDVCPGLTGEDPFQEIKDGGAVDRPTPLVIFLGLDEKDEGDAGGGGGGAIGGAGQAFQYDRARGRPWFAIDVTPRRPLAEICERFSAVQTEKGFTFLPSARRFALVPADAAIYAHARAVVDWNDRNRFCASCGRPTRPLEGGYKRTCTPLPAADDPSPPSFVPGCPAAINAKSNITFPRTDPVMIVAVMSADGRRLLLGRNRTWTPGRFSTLAGFVEAGESVEDAVRREVWEESGVRVGRVVLHSTQPWPYPNSLMIGAIAQARDEPGAEDVDLDHDPELAEARWFTLDEIAVILRDPHGSSRGEGAVTIPPWQAIANRLMEAVVREGGIPAV